MESRDSLKVFRITHDYLGRPIAIDQEQHQAIAKHIQTEDGLAIWNALPEVRAISRIEALYIAHRLEYG